MNLNQGLDAMLYCLVIYCLFSKELYYLTISVETKQHHYYVSIA